tara:strand:- start:579 stop:911 length:333 start_codon:yes stop_codon:yes gene_type:complete
MKTAYFSFLGFIGIGFAIFFFVTLGPLLIENPNVIEAFKAGYVNPYSSGFSTDAICCWIVLAAWVVYEKVEKAIKYGWVALLLGLVPGVATGFALYLVMRMQQINTAEAS